MHPPEISAAARKIQEERGLIALQPSGPTSSRALPGHCPPLHVRRPPTSVRRGPKLDRRFMERDTTNVGRMPRGGQANRGAHPSGADLRDATESVAGGSVPWKRRYP